MQKLLLLLFSLGVGLLSCKKDRISESTGGIYGTVTPATSVVQVTASNTINGQTYFFNSTVDLSGKFILSELPPGSYVVNFIAAPGYTPIPTRTVVVTANQETDMGEVTLSLAPSGGTITGVVGPSGITYGISVTYTPVGGGYTYSTSSGIVYGSNGSFKIEKLAAGQYTITFIDAAGYITPASRTISISGTQTIDLGTINYTLAQIGSISGTVLPLSAGATVQVARLGFLFSASFAAETFAAPLDANGRFKVTNLKGGYSYSVTVTKATGSTLNAPYPVNMLLASGQDLDIGNLTLANTPPAFPMSWNVDGGAQTSTYVRGINTGGTLKLSTTVNITGGTRSMELTLAGINSTGTYTCNSTTGSSIKYTRKSNSFDISSSYSTSGTGASGVINVTMFDPVHQTISGTFSGKVGSGAVLFDISNGSFNEVRYGLQ